jgi:hypothetical protein
MIIQFISKKENSIQFKRKSRTDFTSIFQILRTWLPEKFFQFVLTIINIWQNSLNRSV